MKRAKAKSSKSQAKKSHAKSKSKVSAKAKPAPRVVAKPKAKPKKAAGRSTALYLYGINDAAEKVATSGCPGIDGKSQIRAIETDGLACWVSEVDRAEFVTNLERHMENLEWLATAGVNHQRTVERLSAQATIVPARFGAVFLSETSLREDVAQRASQLADTLRRLHHTEELGVKIFYAPELPPPSAPANSGREYLAQKAKAMNATRSKTLPANEFEEFLTHLQKSSVAWTQGKTSQQNQVWSGSFLLKKGTREKFHEVLKSFAKRWQSTHQIECTGPWPPYSFV